MTKRELLYADIAYMRDVEGRQWKDIAGIVGLSLGMAHAYYHDPTGEKARARKMKRARACLDCGATINTDGSVTDVSVRCQKCHTAMIHAERRWTPETIVAAIQKWADEHGGIPPVATDWNVAKKRQPGLERRPDDYPSVTAVQHEFGTWNAAITAAGFEPFTAGHYGREGEYQEAVEETVRLYRSGLSLIGVARELGISDTAVHNRLKRAGEPRRSRTAA